MNLLVLGLSHETAPIELRERVAFSASELRDAITSLRTAARLEEVVISPRVIGLRLLAPETLTIKKLSFNGSPKPPLRSSNARARNLPSRANGRGQPLDQSLSWLDSMIIGEPQIFGQMKDAFLFLQTSAQRTAA